MRSVKLIICVAGCLVAVIGGVAVVTGVIFMIGDESLFRGLAVLLIGVVSLGVAALIQFLDHAVGSLNHRRRLTGDVGGG